MLVARLTALKTRGEIQSGQSLCPLSIFREKIIHPYGQLGIEHYWGWGVRYRLRRALTLNLLLSVRGWGVAGVWKGQELFWV